MYGLINKAIKDLVIDKFGRTTWEDIAKAAGILDDDFETLTSYPDQLTFSLVQKASERVNLPSEKILRTFGHYWVIFTAQEGYGEIMELFGKDFLSCMKNLNRMHAHMGVMMPDLQPPRFLVEEIDSSHIRIHYYSQREGLAPMVIGLLEGLAIKFNNKIEIEHLPINDLRDHDEFIIKFL